MDSQPSTAAVNHGGAQLRPSLRARLLDRLLRLLIRPLLRRVRNLAALRRRLQRLDWRAPFREGADAHLDGVPVRLVGDFSRPRVLLYLHGGGFFMEASGMHLRFLQHICDEVEACGVLPAYRLAPEHPYPAGLDDCCRAYEALLAQGIPASSIIIAGESAGGTLSLALLMRLRDRGVALPGGAVMISAGTDLAGIDQHASYAENRHRDALVPPESLPYIVRAYAGDHDPATPGISPLYGCYDGLPPLHFVASASEVLRDDSVLAAERAEQSGTSVELHLWQGMTHAFPLFGGLPEAQAARADIVRFIQENSVIYTAIRPVQAQAQGVS